MNNKQKLLYNCAQCSYQTVKWFGCCPECKEWNTLQETATTFSSSSPAHRPLTKASTELVYLSHVETKKCVRMLSGIKEWDRVLGGGIVPGEFLVVTGDPGIGKSTLLLSVASALSRDHKVIYFSSEESLEQIKMRAERVGCLTQDLLFSDQANLDEVIALSLDHKPQVIIIDSLQNCYLPEMTTVPGSIGQLKEASFRLMRLAKEHDIAVLVTGHITKEGVMAGPKALEHIVDAVFYLQGEDRWQTRVLRSVKNRFGTINEIGFFEMQEQGLQEVPNINQHLLEEVHYSPGSVLISFIEGSRPLLIELQALVLISKYGMPQRVISGIDQTQVVLIAAILEKYAHVKLSAHDIFFKISGSFKIKSSAADLGIALALLSSYFQKPLPQKSLALGELSLTGQVKPINHMGLHVSEAEKFGITNLILAKNQKVDTTCELKKMAYVRDLLTFFDD